MAHNVLASDDEDKISFPVVELMVCIPVPESSKDLDDRAESGGYGTQECWNCQSLIR